jgi:UDP-glucose 4-epimerase
MMSGVLVLGTGQVGTFVTRAIVEEGISVIAADLAPMPGYFARFGHDRSAKLVKADILDFDSVSTLMRVHAVDSVVLTASLIGKACDLDVERAWTVNVHGARVVAQAAVSTGVKRLVFVSSLAVYGRPTVDRITENASVRPLSEYGRTKLAAENVITSFRDDGLDVVILRPCGIYGPLRLGTGSHSARFIQTVLMRTMNGDEFAIKAADNTADEYLYAKDVGRAIALSALQENNSREFVFNVGAGRKTTAEDLRSALQQVVPNARITIEIVSSGHGPPMAPLEASRISQVFGFEPRYNLIEGLSDYIKEARLLS